MADLIAAAKAGDVERVAVLMEAGAAVDAVGERGWTALMEASAAGHADVAAVLLTGGASVDVVNPWGDTALLRASYWGHTDVVKVLVGAGAAVDVVGGLGWTAPVLAASDGYTDVVAVLLGAGGVGGAAPVGWERGLAVLMEKGSVNDVDAAMMGMELGWEDRGRMAAYARECAEGGRGDLAAAWGRAAWACGRGKVIAVRAQARKSRRAVRG